MKKEIIKSTGPNSKMHLKTVMLENLELKLGIVTVSAKMTGISRKTHYQWLQEDEEYARQVKDVSEVAIDFAESQLHKQMLDGIPSSTIFYLKTKAKHRGYVERQEFTGANGESLIQYVDPKKLSKSALREYIDAIEDNE